MRRVQTRYGAFPRMHDNRCYVKSSHGRLSRPLPPSPQGRPGLDQKDTPSRWRFRPPPTLTFRSRALRPSSYGLRERFRPTCAPCSTQEATYWDSTRDARPVQNELPQFATRDFARFRGPARSLPAAGSATPSPLFRQGSALDQKDTPSRWRFRPPPTLTFRSQALRPSSYGLRERFRPTCAPCSTQFAI
jgi:hypothetical protein